MAEVKQGTWYQRNKERFIKYAREYRIRTNYSVRRHQKLKLKALEVVGCGKIKCSRCGTSDIRILEINHINGGGNKERRSKVSSYYWYTSIIKGERKIDDLNILCKICNLLYFLRRRYGLEFDVVPKQDLTSQKVNSN